MSDELLPCPFCGGTDIVVGQFKGHAVEAWNRRRPNCGVRVEAMHEPDMDR